MTCDPDNHKRTLWTILISLVMVVCYVLSYAPVYRLGEARGWCAFDEPITLYRPVDWLIDNTPLDEPLYRWANCWGVRDDFVWDWAIRAINVDEDP